MKKVIPKDAVLVPDQAERVFEGMIFDVYQWPQKLFDGSEYRFEMLKRPDTVSVICVADDRVLVVDDEQPHLGSRRSFPGGRIDKEDADVLAAAKREIKEETGYSFESFEYLGKTCANPSTNNNWMHMFLAKGGVLSTTQSLDDNEDIEVHLVSIEELKELLDTNQIIQSMHVTACYYAFKKMDE